MLIDYSVSKLLLVSVLVLGFVPAKGVAQHVHGLVELGVVIEGDKVAVSLASPLSDVVGFEHEPESEEQIAKIQQAASMLANADAMFGLPESADCNFSDSSIDGPAYVKKHLEEKGAGENAHGHGHEHGHHDEHDSHDSESGHEEHNDINASYEWVCDDASKLDVLELRFTDDFASVETIEIQLLTATGAQVLTKEGRVASIPLSSP